MLTTHPPLCDPIAKRPHSIEAAHVHTTGDLPSIGGTQPPLHVVSQRDRMIPFSVQHFAAHPARKPTHSAPLLFSPKRLPEGALLACPSQSHRSAHRLEHTHPVVSCSSHATTNVAGCRRHTSQAPRILRFT